MKKLMIISVIILFLVSCSDNNIWDEIKNKEFSNLEEWAGHGLYFFEEDNNNYCTFMIYGSGLPVAFSYTSEVKFDGENIIIEIPINIEETNETTEVALKYEDGFIIFSGSKYENMEFKMHEYIKDLKE